MMQTPWHFQIFAKGSFFCTQFYIVFSVEITRVQRFPFIVRRARYSCLDMLATFGRFLFTGAVSFETSTWLRSLTKIYEQNIGNEKNNIPQWESLSQGVSQFVFLCVLCFYRYVHFIRARLWRLGRCLSHQLHCWLPVSSHWFSEGMVITSPEVRVLCTHESQDSRYVGISLIIPR